MISGREGRNASLAAGVPERDGAMTIDREEVRVAWQSPAPRTRLPCLMPPV
jgi:hypothetical protein